MHSESTVTPLNDHHDAYYAHDNAVPIVQRESSLSRLQEVFTDRPITQVSLPQGTPRHSPRDVHPMISAEVHSVYAEPHQPVLVPNTSVHSVQPEFVRSASQHRGRVEDRHHHSGSRRDYRTRVRTHKYYAHKYKNILILHM